MVVRNLYYCIGSILIFVCTNSGHFITAKLSGVT
jgi:hypothetical protein